MVMWRGTGPKIYSRHPLTSEGTSAIWRLNWFRSLWVILHVTIAGVPEIFASMLDFTMVIFIGTRESSKPENSLTLFFIFYQSLGLTHPYSPPYTRGVGRVLPPFLKKGYLRKYLNKQGLQFFLPRASFYQFHYRTLPYPNRVNHHPNTCQTYFFIFFYQKILDYSRILVYHKISHFLSL